MQMKIIHCFWSGGAKTRRAQACLASWRRFAPDWEVREWSPTDLPSDLPPFCADALRARKWAMVSDWVRIWALHEQGGLYLDLDVELVKPITLLPAGEWVSGEWTANGAVWMNPGSGLALEKGSPIAAEMLARYERLTFDPAREMMVWINENLHAVAKTHALNVLPPEVMSPIDTAGRMHRTEKTVGIHWYAMSWAGPKARVLQWISWHGGRPFIDALLKIKRMLTGRKP